MQATTWPIAAGKLFVVLLLACAQPPAALEKPDTRCVHPNKPDVNVCCGAAGERPGANCIPWALLDNCSKEGDVEDGKLLRFCCPGLQPIAMSAPLPEPAPDGGTCSTGHDSINPTAICAYCPDGKCGPAENRCNCPQDCK
jgi:hypothetical protein